MKNKNTAFSRHLRFWLLEILFGILFVAGVCFFYADADMKTAEKHLNEITTYVKNQCHSYSRLNFASESKGLMRIMQSVRNIDAELTYEGMQKKDNWETKSLEEYADRNYMTGVFMLDSGGRLQGQYYVDKIDEKKLEKYLKVDSLLETAVYPEKIYAVRIPCEDGSYIDLAACGRSGDNGIIGAYYHTPVEYVESFFLSVQSFLEGYNIESDGTIVVADGVKIVAANDKSLVGKSTDDIMVLKSIREKGKGAKLVQTSGKSTFSMHKFGLMRHGRNYYIYAYMSERDVFDTTPKHIFYSMMLYLLVLVAMNMVRWKTERKYQEERICAQQEYTEILQSKNEQLKQAVSQADRANAAKTSFLSRMSHDIRTPLNGILGLLKIDEAHPDDKELICANRSKIMIAANHLLALINDILQMSKLESGEVILSNEIMNLSELSMEIQAIVEQRAVESGITLEYDQKPDEMKYPYVYGSPLHMRQLFLNIYGNCIKYNKFGGKVTTILKCEGTTGSRVIYRWIIADTGVGMSQEFLKHIFDPFSQERSDARSVYNGTGLGMAIVKGLVDEMHGTIEVTSKEGIGSTFDITLPFEISEESVDTQREEVPEAGSIRGIHLLIAEDNELNAEIIETLLEDVGAEITIARDGQEAVELFKINPQGTFDAILMDVMMPYMNGLEATRIIRSLDRADAEKIPIIAMTANAFEEDVKKCIEAGMNAHLSKPLQMDKVIAVIYQYYAEHT